jgi:hypothetical protein
MGLFDFFKRRKDPLRGSVLAHPGMKMAVLRQQVESVGAQAASLRAVGREADADKAISNYLQEIFQEYKADPYNQDYLKLLCSAAMDLNAPESGKRFLQIVIQANEKSPLIDLTLVYFDLGRIYNQLHNNPEKEFWCYRMATEAAPPKNCKRPATKKEKAKAHHFAHMRASTVGGPAGIVGNEEQIKYHDCKRRELAPELDWDDREQVTQWMFSFSHNVTNAASES